MVSIFKIKNSREDQEREGKSGREREGGRARGGAPLFLIETRIVCLLFFVNIK